MKKSKIKSIGKEKPSKKQLPSIKLRAKAIKAADEEQKMFVKTWAGKQKQRMAFSPTAAVDQSVENLSKIDHIVVLMLENRSFDHMLGYLSLEGNRNDIDGLQPGMSNTDSNNVDIPIHHFTETGFPDSVDPCHEFECVDEQLEGPNKGFVKNFEKEILKKKFSASPDIVMGYYNADDLPVFDHLAKHFVTFNRWFSSIPAATWPNRLFSITGKSDSRKMKKVPIYDIPSFVRHLDARDVSWGWFNHKGVGTLRLVDSQNRFGRFENFAYFHRRKDPISGLFGDLSFIERAQQGTLPSVSWIDPNFINLPGGSASTSNDDHPPSDVLRGQELVLQLYNALINGPKWDKTMLVITYDEHGGFFDHVKPEPDPTDDNPEFRKYGVRVPAFVVSPWVEPGLASNFVFDHTSIIKTILLRFCMDGAMYPDMGARVNKANHLGSFLSRETARTQPPTSSVINTIAAWKKESFKKALNLQASKTMSPPPLPNDLHKGIVAASKKIRMAGFPEDQP